MRDKTLVLECVENIRKVIPAPNEDDLCQDDVPIIEKLLEECNHSDALLSKCLKPFIEIIMNQRFTDVSTAEIENGDPVFYAQSIKNATRLQEQLKVPAIKQIDKLECAHAFLLRALPDDYLASYLNLLRFSKIVEKAFFWYLMQHPLDLGIQFVNELILEFTNKKLPDPTLCLGDKKNIKSIPNLTIILVYPQINTPSHVGVQRAHEHMFRFLLPAIATCVEKVDLTFDSDFDAYTLTVMCLEKIRECVKLMAARRPNDNIFLAGWGLSSLLNIQAIQKIHGITGLLNFATPMRSHHELGFRGGVDDTMCISYCPLLFIAGAIATNTSIDELKLLQENMICNVGVITVEGADNDLRVSPLFLSVGHTTQQSVERNVLDQIKDFIEQTIAEGGLTPEQRREYLVPVKFPDATDVDLDMLKSRAVGAMNPRGRKKKSDT